MSRKIFFPLYLLAIGSTFSLFAQNRYEDMDKKSTRFVTPDNPKIGDAIVFQYPLEDSVGAVSLLISTDLLKTTSTFPMQHVDDVWQTTWTLQDTSARMILFAFQVGQKRDDNDSAYYEIPVYGDNGKPFQGALQASAFSMAGLGGKRPEDLDAALAQIKKEIELYPENYGARLFEITLLLKSDRLDYGTRYLIGDEIKKLEKEQGNDPEFLDYAIQASRQIGDESRAKDYEKKLIERNPDSDPAIEIRLNQILEDANSPENRAAELQRLLAQHPGSRFSETILSQLATAYIETGDSLHMIVVGDRLLEEPALTPQGASALAGLAGWLSEKRLRIGKAIDYAQRAVSVIENTGAEFKPPELTDAEWESRKRATIARYLDILGWSQVLNGNTEPGIASLVRASKDLFQPSVFYHLAEAYSRAGQVSDALSNYARAAAFGGDIGKLAYDTLSKIWKESGQDQSSLMALLKREEGWIAENHRTRILEKQIARPAPNFELDDTEGGRVRLSDQQGYVVLLCFWATWSKSSTRTLGEIQALTERYGSDILSLAVAMDTDPEDVFRFLDDTGMILPVLLNDKLEETYGLRGVPEIYVIDKKGMIRFEHKGYRPDLTQVLSVELDALLGRS